MLLQATLKYGSDDLFSRMDDDPKKRLGRRSYLERFVESGVKLRDSLSLARSSMPAPSLARSSMPAAYGGGGGAFKVRLAPVKQTFVLRTFWLERRVVCR